MSPAKRREIREKSNEAKAIAKKKKAEDAIRSEEINRHLDQQWRRNRR